MLIVCLKMNICLVHEEYPEETNYGGIATYQYNLSKELVKMGNNVYVICRSLTKSYCYVENGVIVYRIYVKPSDNQIRDYIAYRKEVSNILEKLQKDNKIDIIEVPDWGAETIFFEKYRKVPLVVKLHTPLSIWKKYNHRDLGSITGKMLKWERCMLSKANFITSCSQILKEKVIKEFNISKDIMVLSNPANIMDFYYDEKIKKLNRIIFVGSLEERKGVCVLADALNIVFDKYPNLEMCFVGKDTNRNQKNISTMELIKKIVKKEYRKNLNFVGQIKNKELNRYLNESRVAIFPSLFDNFPYVVLEAMATGVHIVGSKNSGMVEMLGENNDIYNTGDSNDLAEKIIKRYNCSLKNPVNNENIKKVKANYNSRLISEKQVELYKGVIKDYNSKKTKKEELQGVLDQVYNEKIVYYKKEKGGVANQVYKVKTDKNIYIIKKYFYDYDFSLSQKLYKIYASQNIDIIKPINELPISYKYYNYNVFPFLKREHHKPSLKYLAKLVDCEKKKINRIDKSESTITNKMNKYYNYLIKKTFDELNLNHEDVLYVLNEYEKLKKINFDKELYINHGDISNKNIIYSNKKLYLIDFDESCYANRLYDFSVVVVKNIINQKLNLNKYNKFIELLSFNKKYEQNDFLNAIKYYLCKILLEKYYLHETNKIDLFSRNQKKDYYKKYLNLLKKINILWYNSKK